MTSCGDLFDNHMSNAQQEGYDNVNQLVPMEKVRQDSLQKISRLEVSPTGVKPTQFPL